MRTWHTTLAAGVLVTLVAARFPVRPSRSPWEPASTPLQRLLLRKQQHQLVGELPGDHLLLWRRCLGQASVWLARPDCGIDHELRLRRQVRPDQFRHQLRPGLQAVANHADAFGDADERSDGLCVRHIANAVRGQRCSRRGGLSHRAAAVAADFRHRSQRRRPAGPGDVAGPCRRPGPGAAAAARPKPEAATAAAAAAEQRWPRSRMRSR